MAGNALQFVGHQRRLTKVNQYRIRVVVSVEKISVAALFSTLAAAASAFAAFWLARLTHRMLQLQIEPLIAIDFDLNAIDERERKALVANECACDLSDLAIRVSIPSEFTENADGSIEARSMKLVASHDLSRWWIPKLWKRQITPGYRIEISTNSWFSHAREVLLLSNLSETEKAMRGTVIIETTCRRSADNRKYRFEYVYRILVTDNWKYMAIPVSGSNPADAEKRIILRRKCPVGQDTATD